MSQLSNARSAFRVNRPRDLRFREKQLRAFEKLLTENGDQLAEAVSVDLLCPKIEVVLWELEILKNEIRNALLNFRRWSYPDLPKTGLFNLMDTVHVRREPFGLVLIVSDWRTPLMTSLKPLISALLAGNCAFLKLHPNSPSVRSVLYEVLPKYLDNDCYQVLSEEIDSKNFDFIYENEFKGKNCVYVDNEINFERTARRIIWGKMFNSGLTTSAPEYVLCSKETEAKLIPAFEKAIKEFFGEETKLSTNFGRLSPKHFDVLVKYLNGNVILGGGYDAKDGFIEITIVNNVKINDNLLKEEILGPILPILTVKHLEEAVKCINHLPKSEVLYIFSNCKNVVDKLVETTCSSSICVNDVMTHEVCEGIPCRSVGGKHGIETFSYKRSCVYRDLGAFGEGVSALRYPPYTKKKLFLWKTGVKKRNLISIGWFKTLLVFVLGFAVSCAYYSYAK